MKTLLSMSIVVALAAAVAGCSQPATARYQIAACGQYPIAWRIDTQSGEVWVITETGASLVPGTAQPE